MSPCWEVKPQQDGSLVSEEGFEKTCKPIVLLVSVLLVLFGCGSLWCWYWCCLVVAVLTLFGVGVIGG